MITISFERHIKYTKSIISRDSEQNGIDNVISSGQTNSVSILLARDCFTEVIIFCVGASTGIPGLGEFCLLSAILLAYDFVLIFTWYTAVLALKFQVLVFHDSYFI